MQCFDLLIKSSVVSRIFMHRSLGDFDRASEVEGRDGAWSKTAAYAFECGCQHCHGYKSKVLQSDGPLNEILGIQARYLLIADNISNRRESDAA